jgi:hypothetical protein
MVARGNEWNGKKKEEERRRKRYRCEYCEMLLVVRPLPLLPLPFLTSLNERLRNLRNPLH